MRKNDHGKQIEFVSHGRVKLVDGWARLMKLVEKPKPQTDSEADLADGLGR